jgi:dienelactone hydrolase
MILIVVALALATVVSVLSRPGGAEEQGIVTELVTYSHAGVELEGFLARPAAANGDRTAKHPGVLIVHAWKGVGDHERETARRLAERGYVAFALDVYGAGIRPETTAEAGAQAGKYRGDRELFRARMRCGLDWLKARAGVDSTRTAALGFCFGGGGVLELARSGADLLGVVSFHGNLDTPDPKDARNIKGSVLVLHGADDPHVPMEQVTAFMDEMRRAKVDWQLVAYGGAVHAFSDPGAGTDVSRGAAYDEKAAARSFKAALSFFRELFNE